MKKNKNLVALIFILVAIGFFTSYPLLSPASAIEPQIHWSNESLISLLNLTLTAADPSIATDSQGNVHIIWMQKLSNIIGEVFYTKLDKFGNTIISNQQLTNFNSTYGFFSSIAVDKFDNIHIVWMYDLIGSTLHGTRYTRLYANGTIAVNGVLLPGSGTGDPQLSVDNLGNINVAWRGDHDVYYGKFDNQGNLLVPIYSVYNAGIFEPLVIKLATDNNGFSYLMWMEEFVANSTSRVAHVKYSYIDQFGNVLINGSQLDIGMGGSDYPAIAIDKQNNVIFSWNSDYNNASGIYLSKINSNGTFLINKKLVLPNVGNDGIVVNSLGRIGIFGQGRVFSQLDSLGNIIIGPTIMGAGQIYSPKFASDRQGNIHIVWHEGQYRTARVKYQRSLNPSNIVMLGSPRVGSSVNFLLQESYDLKANYVLGMSTNISQGVTLPDGRITPLDNTPLLQTSLTNPQSIGLYNSIGRLRINQSKVTLAIPNIPSLSNSTFYTSFVTLDSNGNVVSISDAFEFTVI
ncbi:MAG: hypothetical protein AABX23_04400 [Nanoarchaeota archaeon]